MDTPNLAETVRSSSRAVIDAELRRLARRAPALGEEALTVVDAALQGIADHLLLDRLRDLGERADALAPLFAQAGADPEPRVRW